ncbi:MAG: hypothetical protein QE487_11405 [Fluviicola sp.]|nr:hypothetical protein [Fluviicola sp.]
MKFPVIMLLICCCAVSAKAQDSLVYRLGTQVVYHPYDLFTGFQAERENGTHQHQIGLSVGASTTFFQRRLYPQLHYQYGFHLVKKRWIQTGPLARLSLSTLRFNKQSSHGRSYQEEAFLGAYVGTGNRSRFRFSAGIGPAVEQNWSSAREKFVHSISWNTFAEISWSYAL